MNTWKTHAFVISGMLIGIFIVFGGILNAQAGSLEPPASAAPSGTPVPTMKTQDQLHPAWAQKFNLEDRFLNVLGTGPPSSPGGKVALLDKETGLVWERNPNATLIAWAGALNHCIGKEVGGRKGWRLPSVHELATLIDPSNADPALPSGSVPLLFNVQSSLYWSASTDAITPTFAWFVNFFNGSVGSVAKSVTSYVWCVRGGGPLSDY